jgi:short-subunit dehydrogenase
MQNLATTLQEKLPYYYTPFARRFLGSGNRLDQRKLAKELEGKTIMITGGSSGIGLSVARQLGHAGGKVILVARTLEKLQEAQQEVQEAGGTCFIYSCDLSSPGACRDLVQKALTDHDHVDILINNAGRSIRRSVHHSHDRFHDFQRTMDINYFGAVQLVIGLLPKMVERDYGHIINISSIGVQANAPRFSAYVASKAALDAFSRCIASEVAHHNIHLTNVFMPLVRTPMIAPTKIYNHVPALNSFQAAQLVLKPLISKQKKVTTPLGSFAEIAYDISPRSIDWVQNLAYRLFPDSNAKNADGSDMELGLAGKVFARLSSGVHW